MDSPRVPRTPQNPFDDHQVVGCLGLPLGSRFKGLSGPPGSAWGYGRGAWGNGRAGFVEMASLQKHAVPLDERLDGLVLGIYLFNMLGAISQFETEIRAERQREGIEKAKANGVAFGRQRALSDQEVHDLVRKQPGGPQAERGDCGETLCGAVEEQVYTDDGRAGGEWFRCGPRGRLLQGGPDECDASGWCGRNREG